MKLAVTFLLAALTLPSTSFAFVDMKYERQAEAVHEIIQTKIREQKAAKAREYKEAYLDGYAQAVLDLTGKSLEVEAQ